jgi:hypothetical protein
MRKRIKLKIIILCTAIVVLCGIFVFGIREQHGPTKKEFTGAVIAQWSQYFRLYHELNKPPAPNLEMVLDTVSNEARREPDIARSYDEKTYNKNKKN